VAIRFQAMVGKEKFACGQTYTGIGTTGSKIAPRDFRYYVHNVRLVDIKAPWFPFSSIRANGSWTIPRCSTLKTGTWSCVNGTRETKRPAPRNGSSGTYTALLFTVGVPFNKNHTELTSQPPPAESTPFRGSGTRDGSSHGSILRARASRTASRFTWVARAACQTRRRSRFPRSAARRIVRRSGSTRSTRTRTSSLRISPRC